MRTALSSGVAVRARGLAPVLPLLLIGLAAALRFYDLGFRSLWLDEVTTAEAARLPSIAAVLAYVSRDASATPLTYVITWVFRPFGGEETAIRLPYAIAGVLTVAVIFALGSRLYGRRTGFAGGLLMAILPYAIFYSQEARSYAWLMLFSSCTLLAAHRAVERGRTRDWVVFGLAGLLDLYSGYLAIPILVAAYASIALNLLGTAVRTRAGLAPREANVPASDVVKGASLAAAVIGLGFVPWIPNLLVFLGRSDQGFGRAPAGHEATLLEAQALLQQLDLHGMLLWLVGAGIARTVIDLFRGRTRAALLPLLWLGVPVAGFALGSGGGIVTIWPRYFGAVYPAAVLLGGIGIDGVGLAFRSLLTRVQPSFPPARRGWDGVQRLVPLAVTLTLLAATSADVLPETSASYTRAKGSDYRGAIDAVLQQDRARPVVLVVGPDPAWTVSGLDYYAWVRHSRVLVVDALQLSAADMAMVGTATSVWGAARAVPEISARSPESLRATLFADIWLYRNIMHVGPVDAARGLLEWASGFEPSLAAAADLVDVLQGDRIPGPEALPPSSDSAPETARPSNDQWILQPGASLSGDGKSFVIAPSGRSANVYLTTSALRVGAQYVMSFECGTSQLVGEARVFVVADAPSGRVAFPSGAGYACRASSDRDRALFALTVPGDATSVRIWLRASGTGVASFESVSLRPLE